MNNYEGFDYEDFDRCEQMKKNGRRSMTHGCDKRIGALLESWGVEDDDPRLIHDNHIRENNTRTEPRLSKLQGSIIITM